MKKTATFLLTLIVLASACKNNKTGDGKENGADSGKQATAVNLPPQAEHDLKIFRKAWQMADPYTAVYALNSYLMYDSTNIDMKDTLAQLYVEMNQPIAALKIVEEVLKARPNDTTMLQLSFGLSQSIGQPEKGIAASKKLMEIFPDELQYKVSYASGLMMKPETAVEGEKMLLEVINDPRSLKQTTPYNDIVNGRQVPKKLSLKVAALMLMGEAYGANGDLDKGEQYFREALKVDPNFKPAAEAILQIKSMRR